MMKKSVALVVLSLGFAAHAETKDYTISHPCQLGEVAVVQPRIVQKGDGTFVVRASCAPADCWVRMSKNGVTQVQLVEHTGLVNFNSVETMSSQQVIAEFPTPQTNAQIKAEVQKLIQQGYCAKAQYESGWDYL